MLRAIIGLLTVAQFWPKLTVFMPYPVTNQPPQPGSSISGLPSPAAHELARSQQLAQQIKQTIHDHGGQINFAAFMQQALFTPELGYYRAASEKFGKHGDFITAPEIAPLFSQCLAQFCAALLPTLAEPVIWEVGGGSGRMMVALLRTLQKSETLPKQYYVVETSAALRERQQQFAQSQLGATAECITWCEALPDHYNGIVLANELLDALPVQRFCRHEHHYAEQGVTVKEDALCFMETPIEDPRLLERIREIEQELGADFPSGYRSEINFSAEDWLARAGQALHQGVILLIDYGYPRAVYYHPQRNLGTLMCHYQHQVSDDPLHWVGLQDMTAFVDFTAMARVAQRNDMQLDGFTTQAHFLLDLGILSLQNNTTDTVAQLAMTNQIKRLTLPQEMGEVFKVMAVSKNMQTMVPGFGFRNRADELLR